jgi:SAM-dependent methyltransferase
VNAVLDALRATIANHLLRSLAKSGSPGAAEALGTLLPAWRELVQAGAAIDNAAFLLAAREMLASQLPRAAWSLIPSLEKRTAPIANTWTYQNERMTWDIGPQERVLDVGSGGWPFSKATHLADRFPDETTHRVEALRRDDRPFTVVDVERLPFKDAAFDFAFCSHVLEHLDNPGRAIRELMRVSGRGYIEVPTRLSDVMLNFTKLPNHHRWHGLVLGSTLLLIEWAEAERRELGQEFIVALHSQYSNPFQSFFERNRDLFFASLHWRGSIDFLVIDRNGSVLDSHVGKP